MAKRNQVCKKEHVEGTTVLRFIFATEPPRVFEVDVNTLSDEIRDQAIYHGLLQKLGDSYAGADGPEEAISDFQAVESALASGSWASRTPRVGLLIEALMRLTGVSLEDATHVVNEAAKADETLAEGAKGAVAALRGDPRVKKMIARIKLEREEAAAPADAGGTIAGLAIVNS